MRKPLAISGALALAACVSAPQPRVEQPRTMQNVAGLERVMGRTAAQLVALFGEADQDFREETARKLQFAGERCVLDAYLYPRERGGEPVVTYVDARNAAGEDVDRAACVEALARR